MDVEKTMQFIVKTNAATAVKLDRITEKLETLTSKTDALSAVVEDHENALRVQTEWLTVLSKSVQELTTQMENGFTRLARAQANTEENLNILIRTVQDMLHRPPNP